MKKAFIGFFEPTPEEINKSWEEGVFIFDSSALLNLYRYTNSTRNDFLLVLSEIKTRLFMPHQVNYEFLKNMDSTISGLNNSYEKLKVSLKEVLEKIPNILNEYKRHPSINIENFMKLHEEFHKKILHELHQQNNDHPDFIKDNFIFNKLLQLFTDDKIGPEFTRQELDILYKDGLSRYEHSIPPGYKDLANKKGQGNRSIYGDLIIWKQIIAFTVKVKKPVILVTDDLKEDWWSKNRPREELIKEFFDATGIRILIYKADRFLNFAKERLIKEIKQESITEVKEIRTADEQYNTFADLVKNNHLLDSSFKLLGKDTYKMPSDFLRGVNSIFSEMTINDTFKNSFASTMVNAGNVGLDQFQYLESIAPVMAYIKKTANVFNAQFNNAGDHLFKEDIRTPIPEVKISLGTNTSIENLDNINESAITNRTSITNEKKKGRKKG